ncbi:transcription factor IIB [Nitrososphaera sp. AFS]|nr:transcription factor IIB [Nitrososphaera sp. AFS]
MNLSEYYMRCPECQSSPIHDPAIGEYICPKCGYVVIDEINDYGPESVSSDVEARSKNIRASGYTSFSFHDYGLRTKIGLASRDYTGKSINQQAAERVYRIRKWHSRMNISSPKERRLFNVLSRINEICDITGLPKLLAETAAVIYRSFESRSEAKRKSVLSMAAATIYLACKTCSVARSLDEIVRATGRVTQNNKPDVKLAWRYYKMLVMEMGPSTLSERSATLTSKQQSSLLSNEKPFSTTSISSPSSVSVPVLATSGLNLIYYIAKLTNMAKIETRVQRLAIEMAQHSNNSRQLDGKSPNGLAAAYIYIAAILMGFNLPQLELSNLATTTEVTIRNRCKDILSSFRIVIKVKPLLERRQGVILK